MSEPSTATFGGGPPIPYGQISRPYVTFIIVASVFSALSTVCVALRFVSRSLSRGNKGWDDWASLGALIFAYGFLATTVSVALLGGAGYHISQVTGVQFEHYGQIDLANNIIYQCSIALSKYSVLLLYLRIFKVKPFRICCFVMMAIVASYWLSCVLGLILSDDPVEAQWKYWIPHTSINTKAFWLSTSIINICLDFSIMCIPQPLIWRLQLSTVRKALLTMLFTLGLFTCITSIIRCIYLHNIDFEDPTYSVSDAGIWTNVELNMSIICSCGPSFPRVFNHFREGEHKSIFSFSFTKSFGSLRRGLLSSRGSGKDELPSVNKEVSGSSSMASSQAGSVNHG